MQWKDHFNLKGKHAFLAPSNHSWTNYDDEKLISVWKGNLRKIEGTKLHEWAENTIRLGLVQSRAKKTIYMYVNDAIRYNMRVEQPLSYDDEFCFGTADAIVLDGNLLRIHDLKTGETPADIDQLIKYAALFCLDYGYDPNQLIFELRIYQTDQVVIYKPTTDEIVDMMNNIIHKVEILRRFERGEL